MAKGEAKTDNDGEITKAQVFLVVNERLRVLGEMQNELSALTSESLRAAVDAMFLAKKKELKLIVDAIKEL